MPVEVVSYRHRSVSKPMFVVFVLLLLLPAVVAGLASVRAVFHDGVSTLDLLHAAKTLIFCVPFAWLILKPGGRIVLDAGARQLQYKPGWPQVDAAFPLDGLIRVDVAENADGSLQRLVLRYRDHSERPLTDAFSYGRKHQQQVALALNAAISRLYAPRLSEESRSTAPAYATPKAPG